MTPNNRRGRRAAAAPATTAVEPAIAASAERAATERDPAIGDPAALDPAATAAADAPVDAAVLPEPTLVAEPGAPQPIVTASPILAVEPNALDVVQADAAADRIAAGIEPAPDRDGPHAAAAGQPTLTIERSAADRTALRIADVALGDVSFVGHDVFDRADRRDAGEPLSLERIMDGLQLLDGDEMDVVRACFFGTPDIDHSTQAADARRDPDRGAPMVSVIEVVGPPQGRRRAGMTFGPQAQRFLASDLSADEVAALRADPLLAVGITEVAEAEADADAALYP